jgi:hypothetical protein
MLAHQTAYFFGIKLTARPQWAQIDAGTADMPIHRRIRSLVARPETRSTFIAAPLYAGVPVTPLLRRVGLTSKVIATRKSD